MPYWLVPAALWIVAGFFFGRFLAVMLANPAVCFPDLNDAAVKRSLSLLLDWLSTSQIEELCRFKYFHVKGGRTGLVYRIRADCINYNVELGKNCLCARPSNGLNSFNYTMPVYDMLLGQMLAIMHDEETFVRVANVKGELINDLAPSSVYRACFPHADCS